MQLYDIAEAQSREIWQFHIRYVNNMGKGVTFLIAVYAGIFLGTNTKSVDDNQIKIPQILSFQARRETGFALITSFSTSLAAFMTSYESLKPSFNFTKPA